MSLTRPLIYCAPHNAVNNLQVASAGWLQGTCRLHSWASSHSVMKDKVISAGVQVFPSQRNRTWRVPYLQRSRNNFCFLSVCLFGRWQQGRPKCDILFLKFFCLFSFWNCFLSSHSCCSYWHAWRLCRYQISAYTWIFFYVWWASAVLLADPLSFTTWLLRLQQLSLSPPVTRRHSPAPYRACRAEAVSSGEPRISNSCRSRRLWRTTLFETGDVGEPRFDCILILSL